MRLGLPDDGGDGSPHPLATGQRSTPTQRQPGQQQRRPAEVGADGLTTGAAAAFVGAGAETGGRDVFFNAVNAVAVLVDAVLGDLGRAAVKIESKRRVAGVARGGAGREPQVEGVAGSGCLVDVALELRVLLDGVCV